MSMWRSAILPCLGLAAFFVIRQTGCNQPMPMSPAAAIPLVSDWTGYDLEHRAIEPVPPGTVVGAGAPAGFSHLVLKSCPRVASESLSEASETTRQMVSMVKTIIAADVQAEPGEGKARYRLANVAAGLATDVEGNDTVVTSSSAADVGLKLGFLQSTVLSGAEAFLAQGRCVARSPLMAVLDMPSLMVVGEKHRPIVLRYALLVDPVSGRLDTLVWPLRASADQPAEVLSPPQRLPENMCHDCLIHIDRREYVLGMPTTAAFAMAAPPPGRCSLDLPDDLRPLAAESPLTELGIQRLDAGLRRLIAERGAE